MGKLDKRILSKKQEFENKKRLLNEKIQAGENDVEKSELNS